MSMLLLRLCFRLLCLLSCIQYVELNAQVLFVDSQGVRVPQLGASPPSPVVGQMYYNTSNHKLMVYILNSWVELGGGSDGNFLARNGSTPLTNHWDVGDFNLININVLDADAIGVSGNVTISGSLIAGVGGAALGLGADSSTSGAAIGASATGNTGGAAIGYMANASSYGVAIGRGSNGANYGTALGYDADGRNFSVAIGTNAGKGDNSAILPGAGNVFVGYKAGHHPTSSLALSNTYILSNNDMDLRVPLMYGKFDSGNLGIGVSTPPITRLEVAGTIKLGDGGETCGVLLVGALRYHGNHLQLCNGASWLNLGPSTDSIVLLEGNSENENISIGTNDNYSLSLKTNNVSRVILSNDGNVSFRPFQSVDIATQNYNSNFSSSAYNDGDAFGSSNFLGARYRGTLVSPQHPLGGDRITSFSGMNLHGGSSSFAGMSIHASENHTNTSKGMEVAFTTVANGSLTSQRRMTISPEGYVGIGGGTAAPKSTLQVKGYAQLDTVSGMPPVADCDSPEEYGRMKVEPSSGSSALIICTADGWRSVSTSASIGNTLFCSKSGSQYGGAGGYNFVFSAADCGGTLPNTGYWCAIAGIDMCGGVATFRVNQPGETNGPGVTIFASNPCGNYSLRALCVKK